MENRLYSKSWINIITGKIDELPGSNQFYYFILGASIFIIQIIPLLLEGQKYQYSVPLIHIFFAISIPFIFDLINYSKKISIRAYNEIKPLLLLDDNRKLELNYSLKNIPAWSSLIFAVLFMMSSILLDFFPGLPVTIKVYNTSSVTYFVTYGFYKLLYFCYATFVFHAVHQLRLIRKIFSEYIIIDLFRVKSYYSFSILSSISTLGLVLPAYGFFALNPDTFTDPTSMIIGASITIFAIIIFIWPLLGVHRLLKRERNKLLEEVFSRFKLISNKLHTSLDENEIEQMDKFQKAIDSLIKEETFLRRMQTWPWQSDTVRLFFSTLAVPIGLWIIQFFLKKILG